MHILKHPVSRCRDFGTLLVFPEKAFEAANKTFGRIANGILRSLSDYMSLVYSKIGTFENKNGRRQLCETPPPKFAVKSNPYLGRNRQTILSKARKLYPSASYLSPVRVNGVFLGSASCHSNLNGPNSYVKLMANGKTSFGQIIFL